MQKAPVRPIVEGGVLTAVAILFALISTYVPVIGAFVNLIWPVPIVLLGVRHGYKWSILAVVASGIIIALLMHPLTAISVVVGFGLIGIALGYALRQGFSPAKALALGSAASLVSKAAVIAISAAVMGFNPLNLQTEAMVKGLEQAMEFYRSMGMKAEDLAQLEATMRPMIDLMKIILPAGFVLAAVVDTFLNFQVAKAVLGRLGQRIEPFPPFRHWSVPRITLYALAVALVALYWGKSRELELLYNAGMNLQVITTMLLAVQGMAVFYFLADKYNLSRLVRGIILFLIFSNGIFMQAIIIGGAFDLIFDYRQLRAPRLE
ncbi:YybS family protein [Sporomusa sp.]|uniref:YybS family protein n=1 Tax=Sporomusa sp. TaxID=2078658 RepID=UPI002BBE6F46|nr:YybS family protein [Sporomusa sp.]HWR44082.1 YybS family protein [Sporomusa sp.]